MAGKSDHIFQYNKDMVKNIFEKKKSFHSQQARLPIEEKIKILVKLQKIALTIRPPGAKNDRRMVWKLKNPSS